METMQPNTNPGSQVQSPGSIAFGNAVRKLCAEFITEFLLAPVEENALNEGVLLLQNLTEMMKEKCQRTNGANHSNTSTHHESTTSRDPSKDFPGVEPMQGVEAQAVTERSAQEVLEANLDQLVLPMTEQIDTMALAKMRRRFCSRVQGLKMTISRSNIEQPEVTFTPKEVAQITNFFFSNMLGVKALRRLSKLVQFYSGEGEDRGLSSRARLLAEDSETPHILRAYYSHLHKATDRIDEARVFRHVQHTLRQLDFLKEHKRLKLLAQQRDPQLTEVLRHLGYSTRPGVSLVTCLLDALTSSLGVSKIYISNLVQAHTSIERLVELFGEGVILLLPPAAGRQLLDWGNQRMAFVYPILHDELQGLPELCEYLRVHVLEPLRRGDPIPLAQIKVGTKMSLQQRIQEAIEEKATSCNVIDLVGSESEDGDSDAS